ncbi:hypothetical protein [Paenibacillus ihuae]|uniref:hypothetical protein n=1 Tax=Paenibacillus ihuae TaxID=1232431 RepID=UPI0006D58767|nr:hypothetical protein [Paenibacillus ihuae]
MKTQFNLKLLSALATAVTVSLVSGLFSYLFLEEKIRVRDFSFGYEFTIGLIINLAVLLILILPFSNIADSIAGKTKSLFQKPFISLVLYCGVGTISEFVYSLFTFSLLTIQTQIIYTISLSIVFLFFVKLFQCVQKL